MLVLALWIYFVLPDIKIKSVMGIFYLHYLEIGNYPSMVGHLTTAILNLILPQILKVLINFGSFCNLSKLDYIIRNAQVAPNRLLPCSHHTDIRMRSRRLLRLDDNKYTAHCQQA